MKSLFYLKQHKNRVVLGTIFMLAGSLLSNVEASIAPKQGISLQSTRLIYPENKRKGITFTVKNNALIPYLIQSRISSRIPGGVDQSHDKNNAGAIPFIVLPPLKKVAPDESLTLVIRMTKNSLPKDRESVFALHIKAIPSRSDNHATDEESQQPGKVHVTLALQNTLKLFYRPDGLPPYDVNKIAHSLLFARKGRELVVTNPGPFYITFHSISIGSTPLVPKALFQMVPPYSQHVYPLPPSVSGDIRWQLINDYGQGTETYRRPLAQ